MRPHMRTRVSATCHFMGGGGGGGGLSVCLSVCRSVCLCVYECAHACMHHACMHHACMHALVNTKHMACMSLRLCMSLAHRYPGDGTHARESTPRFAKIPPETPRIHDIRAHTCTAPHRCATAHRQGRHAHSATHFHETWSRAPRQQSRTRWSPLPAATSLAPIVAACESSPRPSRAWIIVMCQRVRGFG